MHCTVVVNDVRRGALSGLDGVVSAGIGVSDITTSGPCRRLPAHCGLTVSDVGTRMQFLSTTVLPVAVIGAWILLHYLIINLRLDYYLFLFVLLFPSCSNQPAK